MFVLHSERRQVRPATGAQVSPLLVLQSLREEGGAVLDESTVDFHSI